MASDCGLAVRTQRPRSRAGAYGLLQTSWFMIRFLSYYDGAPAIGSLLTLAAFVTICLSAWWMRPAAAKRGNPAPAIRRSRWRRLRKSRKPGTGSGAHRRQ